MNPSPPPLNPPLELLDPPRELLDPPLLKLPVTFLVDPRDLYDENLFPLSDVFLNINLKLKKSFEHFYGCSKELLNHLLGWSTKKVMHNQFTMG